jgi:hypothetical protein
MGKTINNNTTKEPIFADGITYLLNYRFVLIKISLLIYFASHATYNWLHVLNLNSVNQLIFVMVKCGVLFVVRTEFLTNI